MSDSRIKRHRSLVAHSQGILLGTFSIPLLLLMTQAYPAGNPGWKALIAGCVLVVLHSTGRYLWLAWVAGPEDSHPGSASRP